MKNEFLHIKAVFVIAVSAASAYFRLIMLPLAVLFCVMLADYVTGMAAAFLGRRLSSRLGIFGIIKKVCYMFAVFVGAALDYLSCSAISGALGSDLSGKYGFFGLLVTVWLILNELISILENLSAIGVPLPAFLKKAIEHLLKSEKMQ